MEKVSMRKLSLLGLVLLAASAVTAAVMPKDKSSKDLKAGVTLAESTEVGAACAQVTCTFTNAGDAAVECTITAGTGTTVGQSGANGTNGTSATEDGNDSTYAGGNEQDSTDVAAGSPNTSNSPC